MLKHHSNTGQPYRLQILINGNPVRMYSGNEGKVCVEGRHGSNFTLRLHNDSGGRVLFVPSVDGLSVIDGKRANILSSGYVVEARGSVDIKGWRTSLEDVAQFQFGTLDKSYAAKMDQPNNVGVIGVVVFQEKPKFNFRFALESRSMGDSGTFGAKGVGQGMGTGFGEKVTDKARYTEFDRQHTPTTVLEVYYDDREGLIANHGVSFRPEAAVATNGHHTPQAFEFCKPPPDEKIPRG